MSLLSLRTPNAKVNVTKPVPYLSAVPVASSWTRGTIIVETCADLWLKQAVRAMVDQTFLFPMIGCSLLTGPCLVCDVGFLVVARRTLSVRTVLHHTKTTRMIGPTIALELCMSCVRASSWI
eukprot:837934-Amphidinium_carterae.1